MALHVGSTANSADFLAEYFDKLSHAPDDLRGELSKKSPRPAIMLNPCRDTGPANWNRGTEPFCGLFGIDPLIRPF